MVHKFEYNLVWFLDALCVVLKFIAKWTLYFIIFIACWFALAIWYCLCGG